MCGFLAVQYRCDGHTSVVSALRCCCKSVDCSVVSLSWSKCIQWLLLRYQLAKLPFIGFIIMMCVMKPSCITETNSGCPKTMFKRTSFTKFRPHAYLMCMNRHLRHSHMLPCSGCNDSSANQTGWRNIECPGSEQEDSSYAGCVSCTGKGYPGSESCVRRG